VGESEGVIIVQPLPKTHLTFTSAARLPHFSQVGNSVPGFTKKCFSQDLDFSSKIIISVQFIKKTSAENEDWHHHHAAPAQDAPQAHFSGMPASPQPGGLPKCLISHRNFLPKS
jgi:hypothetical protein